VTDDESGESIDDQVPVIAVGELESWRLLRLTSCERTLSYTEIEGSVTSGEVFSFRSSTEFRKNCRKTY